MKGITARMLLASAALALVVAAAFGVLLSSIHDLRQTSQRARYSQQVLAESSLLERLVLDLETGHRGFVITGDPRFLEPWTAARERFPVEVRNLEDMVSDDPLQESRARAIERAERAYLVEYSAPLVDTARRDPARARSVIAGGEGRRRVDAMRAQFSRFQATEGSLAAARNARSTAASRKAIAIGIGGLAVSMLLILLFAGYLARAIARPVKRVAAAADRLARGDLSARVPDNATAEIGQLGHSFNSMAGSLEESRDELESQNAELELQTAELEDQQTRLAEANDELAAQHGELERALVEVAEDKRRIDLFYSFAELLAREDDPAELPPRILRELADFAEAEIGLLYVDGGGDALELAAVRGLERDAQPPELRPGDGLPGRALGERRTIGAAHGATSLRVNSFGEERAVRHELHVPLVMGDRCVGVLSLARVEPRPFLEDELEALDHLAGQAAVALANGVSFALARREATINRTVLDATTDGILLFDLEGNVIVSNAAMSSMLTGLFELPADATMLEMADDLADRTVDPAAFRAGIAELVEDPEREQLAEYELVSGRWVHRYTTPVRYSDGTLMGRLFLLREITAERAAERLKSDLVATVSHELRTPLASIIGFSELLADREFDDETRRRFLGTIRQEALRLTGIVNDFLDLQRIEAGHFGLSLDPFDLDELLRDEVELFAQQSTSHRIELALPERPIAILGERGRVGQVIGNLLSNAIKYSPDGGDVFVDIVTSNGSVRVRVRDSGVGIPAEQQDKIFTKFFRVDSSDTREIGGTGLGLALSREIVTAHGGTIGFDSAEGEGTTFWFDLPVEAPARSSGGGARVLLVEDDPVAAALLTEYLAADGHAVEVVATGEAALERAAAQPPALVCLDIRLAGELDGWQVLARLKAARATADVPVIVCTAGNGCEEASALGSADFLTKPVGADRLREAVARLLPDGRGTVLVADDDPAVRSLVLASLGRNGLVLREAADGAAALADVAVERPDAIVLDLNMPNLDGFEVLDRLRADPATRSIPVVVLTARTLSGDERALLQSRAVALLEKSMYSADQLRSLVRQALGSRV